MFGIFNALGSIGFAYSSAIVLMEVEDTLREPPKAAVSMKKTVTAGCVLLLYQMLTTGSVLEASMSY